MTEESERNATGWLSYLASQGSAEALTLQSMLSRLTLPEEPTEQAIQAIIAAPRIGIGINEQARQIYRALYAHITAPKTKTTWNVSWKNDRDSGSNGGEDDFNAAMATARRFAESGCVVTITPLKVPA